MTKYNSKGGRTRRHESTAVFFTKVHPSGTIIENRAIARTFVMWFRQMWESLR